MAKGSSGHTKVYVPTNTSEVLPKKTDDHPVMPAASAPEPEESAVSIIDAPESINTHEEGIYSSSCLDILRSKFFVKFILNVLV